MNYKSLIALGLLPELLSAASFATVTTTTPTPTTVSATKPDTHFPTQPGTVKNCDKFYKVVAGDECLIVESKNDISEDQFQEWNPSINAGMYHYSLWRKLSLVCIQMIFELILILYQIAPTFG